MKTLFRRLKDYLIPPDPQGGCTWPSVELTLPGYLTASGRQYSYGIGSHVPAARPAAGKNQSC